MSKRKMRCQILHLEDLAKCVNKLWHWYHERLLSQGAAYGKWKVYWLNKLIFKSNSGFSSLISSYRESKFFSPRQSLNLYICSSSPPQPVKPFLLYPGGSCDADFKNRTVCQRPGIPDYPTEVSSQTPSQHIKQWHVQTEQRKGKAKGALVGWARP